MRLHTTYATDWRSCECPGRFPSTQVGCIQVPSAWFLSHCLLNTPATRIFLKTALLDTQALYTVVSCILNHGNIDPLASSNAVPLRDSVTDTRRHHPSRSNQRSPGRAAVDWELRRIGKSIHLHPPLHPLDRTHKRGGDVHLLIFKHLTKS